MLLTAEVKPQHLSSLNINSFIAKSPNKTFQTSPQKRLLVLNKYLPPSVPLYCKSHLSAFWFCCLVCVPMWVQTQKPEEDVQCSVLSSSMTGSLLWTWRSTRTSESCLCPPQQWGYSPYTTMWDFLMQVLGIWTQVSCLSSKPPYSVISSTHHVDFKREHLLFKDKGVGLMNELGVLS